MQKIAIVILVVIIGVGGFIYSRIGGAPEINTVIVPTSDDAQDQNEQFEMVKDVAQLQNVDSMEKEDVTSDYSELVQIDSVDPRGGSAEASRYFSEGEMRHTVTATVSDPQEGKFYEGWLVQKTPLKFYSTGKMEKGEDGAYNLSYMRGDDAMARYGDVVITEETLANGLDGKPEAHIFEGSF